MDNQTKIQVLMLEDAELDVELIRYHLNKPDFLAEYRVVKTRKEFIDAIASNRPDVILSSYTLPGFSGLEVLEYIKSKNLNIPFIVVTGVKDEETAVNCIKAGADDYLIKDRLARLPSAILQSINQWRIKAEKEKAYKALEQSRLRLSKLLKRIEEIRDEEKRRISLELHDQLGQELTASKLGLFWIKQELMGHHPDFIRQEPLMNKIDELIELSTQTIQSVRRISHDLRPVVLDDLGLIPAIEWVINKYSTSTDIRFTLDANIHEYPVGKGFASAAFHIIQEALTNVLRHAEARFCGVQLNVENEQLKIFIWDDGIGFNPEEVGSGQLGLFGIEERLRPFEGKLMIDSELNNGTSICVKVPLKNIGDEQPD